MHTCMHQEAYESEKLLNEKGGAGGSCFDQRHPKLDLHGNNLTYYPCFLLVYNAYYPEVCLK